MPSVSLLSISPTITGDRPVGLSLYTRINGVEEARLGITATVNDAVLRAARAKWRRVELTLEIDHGSGVLSSVSPSDLGSACTIVKAIDGYADEMSFGLQGQQWNPLKTAFLRARRRVRLTMRYGEPGALVSALLFDGNIYDATTDATSGLTNVTAMGRAIQWADVPVNLNHDFGHGLSRNQVARSLISQHGIPVGTFRTLGASGSRRVVKPIVVAEMRLFDFIREFMTPAVGHPHRVYFAGGRLHIARLSADSGNIRADLTIRDVIGPVTIETPPTNEANEIECVTVRYDREDINGLRMVTEDSLTEGVYGEIDANGVARPERFQKVARIVTKTTYRGDTPVRTEVETWGWYSPRRTKFKMESDGTLSEVSGGVQYPDGTWRVGAEQFIVINRRVEEHHTLEYVVDQIDSEGFAVHKLDRKGTAITITETKEWLWEFRRKAIWDVQFDGSLAPINGVPVTEDGEGVAAPFGFSSWSEQFGYGTSGQFGAMGAIPNRLTRVTKDRRTGGVNTDYLDEIRMELTDEFYKTRGSRTSTANQNAWGYGYDQPDIYTQPEEAALTSSVLALNLLFGTVGLGGGSYAFPPPPVKGNRRTTTTYKQTTEDSYRATAAIVADDGTVRTTHEDRQGAAPYVTHIQATQKSQEIRATVSDAVRVALSGAIPSQLHNEWAETRDEAENVARGELQERSAIRVRFKVPVQGGIDIGKWLRLDLPSHGIHARRMRVVNLEQRVGVQSFSQTITAHIYPAEVL